MERLHELIALELLGLIDDDERLELERLSSEGEIDFNLVTAEVREQLSALALIAPEVSPPPFVKAELLSIVRGERAPITIREKEGWTPHQLPGVKFKELHRSTERVTVLFDLEPGATFPSHSHHEEETTFIVEGSISDSDGTTWNAGDFVIAPEGSEHGPLQTSSGCMAILTMSVQDFREPRIGG